MLDKSEESAGHGTMHLLKSASLMQKIPLLKTAIQLLKTLKIRVKSVRLSPLLKTAIQLLKTLKIRVKSVRLSPLLKTAIQQWDLLHQARTLQEVHCPMTCRLLRLVQHRFKLATIKNYKQDLAK